MKRKILHNIIIIALLWSYSIFPVAQVLAQDSCAENLNQAEQNYYEGKFDESIALVRSCLQAGGLQQDELVRAYKILAQTYLAKNNPDASRQIVKKILETDPNYTPTIAENPPPYVELVNSVKAEQTQKEESAKSDDAKWLWIGAGSVAVVGVLTIILLSGSEDEPGDPKPLPTPPAFPSNNE